MSLLALTLVRLIRPFHVPSLVSIECRARWPRLYLDPHAHHTLEAARSPIRPIHTTDAPTPHPRTIQRAGAVEGWRSIQVCCYPVNHPAGAPTIRTARDRRPRVPTTPTLPQPQPNAGRAAPPQNTEAHPSQSPAYAFLSTVSTVACVRLQRHPSSSPSGRRCDPAGPLLVTRSYPPRALPDGDHPHGDYALRHHHHQVAPRRRRSSSSSPPENAFPHHQQETCLMRRYRFTFRTLSTGVDSAVDNNC